MTVLENPSSIIARSLSRSAGRKCQPEADASEVAPRNSIRRSQKTSACRPLRKRVRPDLASRSHPVSLARVSDRNEGAVSERLLGTNALCEPVLDCCGDTNRQEDDSFDDRDQLFPDPGHFPPVCNLPKHAPLAEALDGDPVHHGARHYID